jgi:hypothetical protein
MAEDIKEDISMLDEAEYNRLVAGYAESDDIEQELDKALTEIGELSDDLKSEYQRINNDFAGFTKTKFDIREHLLRTIELRIKVLGDKGKRRKEVSEAALKYKKDILARKIEEDSADGVSPSEAAAIINSLSDAMLQAESGGTDDETFNALEEELKKKEESGEIEFTDGERHMMVAERNYEFLYNKDEDSFTCVDKDTSEVIDIFPDSYLPDAAKYKVEGVPNIEDGYIINPDDVTDKHRIAG